MKYVFITMMLLLASCKSNPINNSDTPTTYTGEKLGDIKSSVVETAKSIEQTLKDTKTSNANVIQQTKNVELQISTIDQIPDSVNDSINTIKSESDKIHTNLDKITLHNNEITKSAQKLDSVNTNVLKLENKITQLQQENDKTKQEAVQKLYSYLGLIFIIGSVVVLVGVGLAIFYERKVGMTIAGLGILALSLAAGATFYLKYLAIVGALILGGTIIGTTVYLALLAIKESKKKEDLEKITEENVELIEMVKQELPADKKVEIFGDRAKPGLAHNLQSQKTKDKVQEIRKTKLKDKINPTITRI